MFQIQRAKTKLAEMSERIQILENALRSCRCQSSIHDLLSEDLLHIKEGTDEVFPSEASEDANNDEAHSHSATFGTLSVSGGRNLRYFGSSGTIVRMFFMISTILSLTGRPTECASRCKGVSSSCLRITYPYS